MFTKEMSLAAISFVSSVALAGEVIPVSTLDAERYMGTWYEIASIPQIFQTGCMNITAIYTLQPDASVKVENKCRLLWSRGFPLSVTGQAVIPNIAEPAKLKVSFFNTNPADYWVLDLATDYSYALVGGPSRTYLWILSREKTLAPEAYNHLLQVAEQQGFDTQRLRKTKQE